MITFKISYPMENIHETKMEENAFHSLVNLLINEKNLSESRRMNSLPFYIITECFVPD